MMDKEKWKSFKDLKPFEQRKQPTFTYPDKKILNGIIIDEIRVDSQIIDENTTGKVYRRLVQLVKWKDGREEIRSCYYYINFNKEKPKWIFGESALTLSKDGFKELIDKMREKDWI